MAERHRTVTAQRSTATTRLNQRTDTNDRDSQTKRTYLRVYLNLLLSLSLSLCVFPVLTLLLRVVAVVTAVRPAGMAEDPPQADMADQPVEVNKKTAGRDTKHRGESAH